MSRTQYSYAFIALVALILCWSQNLQYMGQAELGGMRLFLNDLLATPASRSFAFDISLFFLSAAIWMVQDARKYRIPHVWAYLLFGLLIAISVTFPLYLLVRESHLKQGNGGIVDP